jgi:hypothetical protein
VEGFCRRLLKFEVVLGSFDRIEYIFPTAAMKYDRQASHGQEKPCETTVQEELQFSLFGLWR